MFDIAGFLLLNLGALIATSSPLPNTCPPGHLLSHKPASEQHLVLVHGKRWELSADSFECVEVDEKGNVPGTRGGATVR